MERDAVASLLMVRRKKNQGGCDAGALRHGGKVKTRTVGRYHQGEGEKDKHSNVSSEKSATL